MAAPGGWVLGRRTTRSVLIALLFPLPFLALASAAMVVMVTTVHGWRAAALDCAGALLVLVMLMAAAGELSAGIGLGALVTWAVALLLGHLRQVASLTLAVQVAVLMGVLGTMVFSGLSQDPQAYWEQVLRDVTERARSAGIEVGPADLIPGAAQLMTGVMAASAVASSLAALFLGCWWSGRAGGRGFGAEFRELRMGRVLTGLAAVTAVLLLTALRPSIDDILLVLGMGFVVQGLSVVHWHGFRRDWPRAWPLALYLPLALVPGLAVVELALLALVGLADNGYGLRRGSGNVV